MRVHEVSGIVVTISCQKDRMKEYLEIIILLCLWGVSRGVDDSFILSELDVGNPFLN